MNDNEQLQLIGLFHYVLGALLAASSYFSLFPLFFGISSLIAGSNDKLDLGILPPLEGWQLVIVGGVGALIIICVGGLIALSGYFIARKRRRGFSVVVAAISCIFIPLGTVLGIITLIILRHDEVIELYRSNN